MAVLQSGKNVQIGYKVQGALGTPASGAGATGLRVVPSPGLQLSKQIIKSNEVRRDGQSTRGRHGTKSVAGSYQGELSAGGTWDALMEAGLRSTYTATFDVTNASTLNGSAAATSVTTTTSTIVVAAGSLLTQGVRTGDMIKLTGFQDAGNNGVWFRVVNVVALTITVAGTPLILNATPDTTFTITVAKSLVCGATPTERYFTFEEYGADIDAGPIFSDCKITKMEINAQPNAPVVVTLNIMGLVATSASGGSSPTFTPTPTYTTTLPLVVSDGLIRINGVDYNVLTGFTITWDLGGQTPATLSTNSPDVFMSNAQLSGTFSLFRADMTMFDAFNNETQFDIFMLCRENTAEPRAFVSFYIGNLTLSGNSAPFGQDGALTETVPWNAGKDEAGGARASTMLKIATG